MIFGSSLLGLDCETLLHHFTPAFKGHRCLQQIPVTDCTRVLRGNIKAEQVCMFPFTDKVTPTLSKLDSTIHTAFGKSVLFLFSDDFRPCEKSYHILHFIGDIEVIKVEKLERVSRLRRDWDVGLIDYTCCDSLCSAVELEYERVGPFLFKDCFSCRKCVIFGFLFATAESPIYLSGGPHIVEAVLDNFVFLFWGEVCTWWIRKFLDWKVQIHFPLLQ